MTDFNLKESFDEMATLGKTLMKKSVNAELYRCAISGIITFEQCDKLIANVEELAE